MITAQQLAERLLARPDWPVYMLMPNTVDPLYDVEPDTFDTAEGPVWVLVPESEKDEQG